VIWLWRCGRACWRFGALDQGIGSRNRILSQEAVRAASSNYCNHSDYDDDG
jgi:hypothetical protein